MHLTVPTGFLMPMKNEKRGKKKKVHKKSWLKGSWKNKETIRTDISADSQKNESSKFSDYTLTSNNLELKKIHPLYLA